MHVNNLVNASGIIERIFESGFEWAMKYLTLSQTTNSRLFQTESWFAGDNFEFNENDRKFSKRVQNAVEKGDGLYGV